MLIKCLRNVKQMVYYIFAQTPEDAEEDNRVDDVFLLGKEVDQRL